MNITSLYLPASIALTSGLVLFGLDRVIRRDFLRGMNVAKKFVLRLSSIPRDALASSEGMEQFQTKVFESALAPDRIYYGGRIEPLREIEAENSSRIDDLKTEKKEAIAKMKVIQEKPIAPRKDASRTEHPPSMESERVRDEVIETRGELAKAEAAEKAGAKEPAEGARSLLQVLSQKIDSTFTQFVNVWFLFLLVVLDYILARGFFGDISVSSTDQLQGIAIAIVLPLVITLVTMWFAHHAFEEGREAKMARGETDYTKTALFGMPAVAISLYILVFRLIGVIDQGLLSLPVLKEIGLWIVFNTAVIIVALEGAKSNNKISVPSIIGVPISLFVQVLLVPVVALFQFSKWIVSLFKDSEKDSTNVRKLKKRIEELEENLKQIIESDRRRQTDEVSGVESIISNDRDRELERVRSMIVDIDREVELLQTKRPEREKTIANWEKRLAELRRGSNEGVLAGLKKRAA